ncbi:MAG: hypothetical protein GTN49_01495 [candidate division Zixibacteria bacterium]|nr:hypothetical protein [candidate division Zixibacteria bacterium]
MTSVIVRPERRIAHIAVSERFEERIFHFPRSVVTNGKWATLPPAAASVYAVLGVHANYRSHIAFASQERISMMAGYSRVSVSKGSKILEGRELILVTRGAGPGNTSFPGPITVTNKYYVRPRGGDWFTFDGKLLWAAGEVGAWSRLGPSARKLYVASRAMVYGEAWDQFWRDDEKRHGLYEWFDSADNSFDLESRVEWFELSGVDYPVPPNCFYIRLTRRASLRLRALAGIRDKRTFDNALEDLIEKRLMAQFGYEGEEALLPIPYPSAWGR